MKYIKILSFLLIILFIVGCEETYPTYTTSEIIDSIEVIYQEDDNQNHVTKSMVFPLESSLDSRIKISWISDNPSIIDYFNTVNRPKDDMTVDVTFTVDNFGSKFSQVMTFQVIGSDQTIESSYTINYFFQNIENDEYALIKTDQIQSEVGKNIVINPEVEQGFILNTSSSDLTGTVLDNDDLVLDIYFDRKVYEITLVDGTTTIDTISAKHGSTISLEDPEKEEYVFIRQSKLANL